MSASVQRNSALDEGVTLVQRDDIVSSNDSVASGLWISNIRSPWIRELEDRFHEITALPIGWDGYRGLPVAFNCAIFAADLLERLCSANVIAPSLVPGSDGTLQIEWHCNNYDIELDVLGPNNVVATRYNHLTGYEEEIELQNDFSPIAAWITYLEHQRELAGDT